MKQLHSVYGIFREMICVSWLVMFLLIDVVSAKECSFSVDENDTTLFVGAAAKKISPGSKVRNWITGKPYAGIRDDIYTRVIVVSDGHQKSVIVHWELTDIGESATQTVREAVSVKLGIPPGNILVNSSHNHSAPHSPVYGDYNFRGKELYATWINRHLSGQNEDPYFKEWMEYLIAQTVAAADEANQQLQPASLWIGRYDISKYLRNRRPRPVAWGIEEPGIASGFNYMKEDWDPYVLGGERTFGSLDRTMTVISFRNGAGENISTLFHTACHAVSVYPFSDEISGDWSGQTTQKLNAALGGENLFLQGCAGDVNPWRRGWDAVGEMSTGLTQNIQTTYRYSAQLKPAAIQVDKKIIGIPLSEHGAEVTGLSVLESEIQAIVIGSLAIVALPGEPMTDIGLSILKASPYPHTIVLGYSNGNGSYYCGMPGERVFGGYETEDENYFGTENAGLFLAETAIDLLQEVFNEKSK